MGVIDKLFGKYLLLTNTVSCGLMMGFGDFLQQINEYQKRQDRRKNIVSDNKDLSLSAEKNETIKTAGKSTAANNSTASIDLNDKSAANKLYEHDYRRTRNMIIVGVAQGPINHYFYAILDRTIPRKDSVSIVKKTLADQLVNSPICLAIFFLGLGTLEEKRTQDIRNEVELKFMDAWKIDWCFWPPVQLINFLFIPLRYRVIYINLMMIIFDTFLSFLRFDAQYD